MIECYKHRLSDKLPGLCLWLLLFMTFLMVLSPVAAREQAEKDIPFLSAALSKDSEKIGSIVDLRLTYRLPEGAVLGDPPVIGGLEDLTVINVSRGNNGILIRLLVDRLGAWKTGEISLAYTDKDGNQGRVKTEPVTLTVLSNLGEKPEEARLKPIRDIIPSKPFWVKYTTWIIGVAVLIIAGIAVFLWFRLRRNKIISQTLMAPPP